jgi:hypothetical protein
MPEGAVTVPKQTLLRLVEEEQEVGGVFDPASVALMTSVLDQILLDLKLVKRDDPIVTAVAKLVIELVRGGERDPSRLRKQVVGRYQPPRAS